MDKQNFFYSASSEAYQDAFLTWLFYNYNSPDACGEFSRHFVGELIGKTVLSDKIKIEENDIIRQKYDSDISVKFKVDNESHLLIIEDKTGSALHPSKKKSKSEEKNEEMYDTQLEKYCDKFYSDKDYKDIFDKGNVHLVFYKNAYVLKDEKEKITRINSEIKNCNGWQIFDIRRICEIFESFDAAKLSKNLIIDSYYKNLKSWDKEFAGIANKNFQIDLNSEQWKESSLLWQALFDKIEVSNKNAFKEISGYNGTFWSLFVYPPTTNNFYFEVTSRLTPKNEFVFKIMAAPKDKWTVNENVRKTQKESVKKNFTSEDFVERNDANQLAKCKVRFSEFQKDGGNFNFAEFESKINRIVDDFVSAMEKSSN